VLSRLQLGARVRARVMVRARIRVRAKIRFRARVSVLPSLNVEFRFKISHGLLKRELRDPKIRVRFRVRARVRVRFRVRVRALRAPEIFAFQSEASQIRLKILSRDTRTTRTTRSRSIRNSGIQGVDDLCADARDLMEDLIQISV